MKKKLLLKHQIGITVESYIPIKGIGKATIEVKNGWVYYWQIKK